MIVIPYLTLTIFGLVRKANLVKLEQAKNKFFDRVFRGLTAALMLCTYF
jgi:hypothetical protein